MPKIDWIWGLGRRKTAVARVRIIEGSGKLQVNKRELSVYFPKSKQRSELIHPLKIVDAKSKFDIFINVKGGGPSGQVGASKLGIARALVKADSEYYQALREAGLLTRDPRMKERKKPGQPGARKSFQYSKR